MKLRVDVTAKDTASPSVAAVISALTGETAAELNAVAARTATLAAADYHRAFDARGGWENRKLPTHGPGRDSTGYGADVADSWHFREADASGATIADDGPYIRHKVKGGTITASGCGI